MAEWEKCTIGDLCNTISDTYKGTDEYVVLVNTSDVLEGKVLNHMQVENKNLKGQFKKTFKRNDILYSEIRPANKRFAFVDFEDTSNYIASTKLMVLRHNDKVLPEFLFDLLKSNYVISELQHLAETRSGTFPQITFSSELAPMKVNLPDKETQRRIVSIISCIEQKIEVNERINNNLAPHPCGARIAAIAA
jgi:type I restriction enzyme S subunit